MIRLEGIDKSIGETQILKDLSLHIQSGEVFTIIGRSGMGKSVTIKHIVGLMSPDRGRVIIDGIDLTRASMRDLSAVRSQIGLVFQSGALINWLNVEDNIALPLRERLGLPPKEIRKRVEESLEQVRLKGQGHKMPAELSGGMKKRVGIARAIVSRPKILLYDEPTSGLDPVTSEAIDRLILDMRESTGATSVVVSHDLLSVSRIADRIGMIHKGKMIAVGTPEEFRQNPSETVQEFLRAGAGLKAPRPTKGRDDENKDES